MKIPKIPAFITVPALCLIIVLSLGTHVSAGGLNSKNKSRIPMQPGLTIDRDLLRQAFILMPVVPSKTERVVMKLRKDQRAAARRTIIVAEVPSEVIVTPTVTIYEPGRDRLASKGQIIPSHCQTLHTHERASCIYHAQLQKTLRVQKLTQK